MADATSGDARAGSRTGTAGGRLARHAWKIHFALGFIFLLFGIGDLSMGLAADPTIAESITGMSVADLEAQQPQATHLADFQSRGGGVWILSMSILLMAVAWQPFRRGERWAWWAMWGTFPLATVILLGMSTTVTLEGDSLPPPFLSAPIFLAAAVLAQLMALPRPLRGLRAHSNGGT